MQLIHQSVALLAAIGALLPAALAGTLPQDLPGFVATTPTRSTPSSSQDLAHLSAVSKRNEGWYCSDISMAPLTQSYDSSTLSSDCAVIYDFTSQPAPVELIVPGNQFYGFKLLRYNSCALMVWADVDYYSIGNHDVHAILGVAINSFTSADGLLGVEGHMTCLGSQDGDIPQAVTWKILKWDGPDTNKVES